MEHNINDSIQKKIRMAEAGPVVWQKERVWDRIKGKAPSSRKKYGYYAAAAAVCLISISLWYTAVQYENSLMDSRITALNLAIDELYQDLVQYPHREKREQPQECMEEKPAPKMEVAAAPLLLTIHENISPEAQVSDSLRTPQVKTQDPPTMVAAIDPGLAKTERVAPIIGVFDQPSPEIAMSKNKRSKLRVQWNQDVNTDREQESKIIIARIN